MYSSKFAAFATSSIPCTHAHFLWVLRVLHTRHPRDTHASESQSPVLSVTLRSSFLFRIVYHSAQCQYCHMRNLLSLSLSDFVLVEHNTSTASIVILRTFTLCGTSLLLAFLPVSYHTFTDDLPPSENDRNYRYFTIGFYRVAMCSGAH